jgi:hypothetical protein
MGAVNQTVTQLAEELAGTGGDPSTISQLIEEDFTSQIATSALDLATSSTLGDNDERNTAAPTGGKM